MQEETNNCCHDHHHEHEHDHSHPHGHEHCHDGHTHIHGGVATPADVKALLEYMTNHNVQHANELADMGEKLRSLGKTEAADRIAQGVEAFSQANVKLAQALKLVKKEV